MSDNQISYIIVLTIGPVQGYISQARRTQDLFQGSRILSVLAGKGAEKAREQTENDAGVVIYPANVDEEYTQKDASKRYASVPNRIVIAWHGNEEGAVKCAREVEAAIRAEWHRISENTRAYFTGTDTIAGHEKVTEIWKEQEATWLECYWVVTAYDDAQPYKYNIEAANQNLGARKLMRDFAPIEEQGLKDSITGEQGVLHGSDATDIGDIEKAAKKFWAQRKEDENNRALLSSSERLGAISTVKRFAHEAVKNDTLQIQYRYPSTSSIAVAPFKYDVLVALTSDDTPSDKKTALKSALKKFLQALLSCYNEDQSKSSIKTTVKPNPPRDLFFTKHGRFNPEMFRPIMTLIPDVYAKQHDVSDDIDKHWQRQFMCLDGDYLYDDTLITKTIAEYMPRLTYDESESKRDYQKRLKPRFEQLRPKVAVAQKALSALLRTAADLDISPPQAYLAILSMDGDKMGKTIGSLACVEQHQEFSATLANFAANDVEQIVEQDHLGRLVYAGGDDVLALLPVRHALDVAESLRREFADKVQKAGFVNHEGKTITASTGIAFVHHTHDLQDAVKAAKDAEKKIAKNAYNRAAIGIHLLRRSGEKREMGSKWQVEHKQEIANLIPHLEVLITAFYYNLLGRSLPYDFERIAYQMDGSIVPMQAQKAEIKRVLKRRFADIKDEAYATLPQDARDTLGTDIAECKSTVLDALEWLVDVTSKTGVVQRWLELARFIAQKESDR